MPRSSAPPSSAPGSIRPSRRTENVRVQGRSARVVDAILLAVAEELGLVGYADLRIEDVATRSGVNKTTIYRRWPLKSELVISAVERLAPDPVIEETGTLRGDLFLFLERVRAAVGTPVGRGLVRMIQAEKAHPEVSGMLRRFRARHLEARRVVFDRARERGEIPDASDSELLAELAFSPLITRLVHLGLEADDAFLRALTDTIVAGARAGAAVRTS
jgi:AcrR family transcriptional regulator